MNLGQNLRQAREKKGLSLNDLAFELRSRYDRRITGEGIRKYEIGRITEANADLILIAELAEVLDKPVRDLSPAIADRLPALRELLIRTGSGYYQQVAA